jgi:hypothetical protein
LFGLFLARWGFAAAVAVAIGIGIVAALTVAPPEELPSVALRAAPVFRVEVGAAVFSGLYLASMAFVLALHNRGFTEIGASGVRARGLAAVSEGVLAESESRELLADLIDEVDEVKSHLRGGRVVD